MRGLLDRLAGADSGAERGLMVIQFFDELVAHRADGDAVTRATAVLSKATAGAIFDESGELHVMDRTGRSIPPTEPGASATVHDIAVSGEVVGRVWLERDEADGGEWDDLMVARFALTMANLFERTARGRQQYGVSNAALLHTLLRNDAPERETARAASLLGFGIRSRVRVAAVRAVDGPIGGHIAGLKTAIVSSTGGHAAAGAIAESLGALIFTGEPDTLVPPGVVGCIGPEVPLERCAQSWDLAARGVRFANASRQPAPWTVATDLGCLIAFADLPPDQIIAHPDVQAVGRIAEARDGTDLEILTALGNRGSMREVATALHMHHSSVAYRVRHISETFGFDVRTPEGAYRAQTAALLWTLHRAPESDDGVLN